MEQKNNGQLIVVKDLMQCDFVRRVWDYTVSNVFITSENGYKRLSNGEETPWMCTNTMAMNYLQKSTGNR